MTFQKIKKKIRKSAKKRFKLTKNELILGKKSSKNHLLSKKSSSRKRRLSGLARISDSNLQSVYLMIY